MLHDNINGRRSSRIAAGAPIALRPVPQWLVWRFVERNGRPAKVPFNSRTCRAADVRDRATWDTYSMARRACRTDGYSGIGFVFTRHDPFCGIDLDNALDVTGEPLVSQSPLSDEWRLTRRSVLRAEA